MGALRSILFLSGCIALLSSMLTPYLTILCGAASCCNMCSRRTCAFRTQCRCGDLCSRIIYHKDRNKGIVRSSIDILSTGVSPEGPTHFVRYSERGEWRRQEATPIVCRLSLQPGLGPIVPYSFRSNVRETKMP